MRFALNSDRLDSEFNPFEDEYLGEILQTIALAWARIKPPKSGEIEDRITFRLAGRLQNDPTFQHIPYDIVPQHWILDIDGRRLGRLDLRFKHRHSKKDYFAFESKRLHVRYPGGSIGTEYSVYSGDPGMGAFVENQYSKDLPAAGMLAYVMDGDTEKAWNGLGKSITNKRIELRLSGVASLVESVMSSCIKNCLSGTRLGESLHDLCNRQLRLFHLLLPVLSPDRCSDESTGTHN